MKIEFFFNIPKIANFSTSTHETKLPSLFKHLAFKGFKDQIGRKMPYALEARVIFEENSIEVFSIEDDLAWLINKLCFHVVKNLILYGTAEYYYSSSYGCTTFIKPDETVSLINEDLDIYLKFDFKELIYELFDCGIRMLSMIDLFWEGVSDIPHPSLHELEVMRDEVAILLETH